MGEPEAHSSDSSKSYDPVLAASKDGQGGIVHDAGVLRALRSRYRPDPTLRGDPTHTLFVSNLHPRTTQECMEQEASAWGRVVRCRVVRDAVTGRSRRYAFVEFSRRREAERAHRGLHGARLDGATLLVEWEAARALPGWRPRRLGGGYGGRRESGQLRFGCRARPFHRSQHRQT